MPTQDYQEVLICREVLVSIQNHTCACQHHLSFLSNNISISGSSVMDGSSIQQNSHHDPGSQPPQQSQQNQGASSATSFPTSLMGQVQLPGGPRIHNSFIQDPTNMSQLQKKPRLDIKQEDILQQQVLQQFMQRQDPMQIQNPSPQFQALMQQQRLRQQKQQQLLLQSMPPMQRVQLLQQQQQQQHQQLQLRQQLKQKGVQSAAGVKRPYDSGVRLRRLMQYLYHQRQRPADNSISYWRKFVAEYYSPRAKKRWCLSLYDNIGHHSLGVFAQAAMDACLQNLEEDLVNQLLQVAQKCHSTISKSGPDGVSQQDLQANSAMVVTAGCQLARSLELQSLNDLGFSKRYVRCLQIAEVISSTKDLMDFCREQKVGPAEGLKNFPRHSSTPKVQLPKMEEVEQMGGLPTDRNALNKLMTLRPGTNSQMNNNQHMVGPGTLSGSAQAALALNNYQNLLMRQNSMNSAQNSFQQEASTPFNTSSQASSSMTPGSSGILPGTLQNSTASGFLNSQVLPQAQQRQHLPSGNGLPLQNQSVPSHGSQALQQQMIQQLLHDMSNKNGGAVPQHSLSMLNPGGSLNRETQMRLEIHQQ